jgi:hypothetical protein
VKILDDFKMLTRDYHINESFDDDGEKFPHLKKISSMKSIGGSAQRNSMHKKNRS